MFSKENLAEDERYAVVCELLERAGAVELADAQDILDGVKKRERDAEWHYMQAAVCYFKRWYLDCRKQLQKAIKLAPEREKYTTELGELTAMAKQAKENGENIYGHWSEGIAAGCAEICCDGICGGLGGLTL